MHWIQSQLNSGHVFVVVAIERSTRLTISTSGSAVTEKLQSIYGEPAVHKFADVELLEFERQGAQSSVQ